MKPRLLVLVMILCCCLTAVTAAQGMETVLGDDGFSLTLGSEWELMEGDASAPVMAAREGCRMAVYRGKSASRARSASELRPDYEQASGVSRCETLFVGDTEFLYSVEEIAQGGETVILHIYSTVFRGREYHFAFAGEQADTLARDIVGTFSVLPIQLVTQRTEGEE